MHLTSRKADMVIKDEPRTRKASHSFTAAIALSALSLGTLSPKKTTCKAIKYIRDQLTNRNATRFYI